MIEIRAGATTLPQWRRLLAGEGASVDAGARSAVEASAAVIERIVAQGEVVYGVNTGFGKLAGVRIGADSLSALQRNLVLSHAAGVGPALPDGLVRLVLALKIASLLHGASGVRWALIERLETALARGLLPEIPAQGSVGASGDLAPLAHLAAALFLGVGAIRRDGVSAPAGEALAAAGLEPLPPGPKEGLALLNGTQVSTALALAGLFATERAFQAALVAGALSVDAAKGSDTPFDDRIHALRGHRGQRDVAAAYRALITGSRIRESHVDCAKVQDPYSLRCQPQVMGAALDVMRQAAGTLEIEAVAVSDNPLVFADTGKVLSGGNFHAEPVAFAADMVALTVAEIGNLAERRIALLTDPVLSGMPAFLTPEPGLNSGFMIAQVTAAALASENKQRATPASIDTIPTSANQEDHVSMATHASRRLLEMAENLVNIVSVELLCGAQAVEFHRPLRSSEPLERVLRLIRDRVPPLGEDRLMAPDIAAIADLVRSGALVETAGLALPAVDSA